MKVNGTGGYAGAMPYARLAQDVGDGFVTRGQQHGPRRRRIGHLDARPPREGEGLGPARALLGGHRGQDAGQRLLRLSRCSYSYFEGCSNGGRQALMMAQNYPELFDGIVAGAPSNFYPDLLMWLLWTGKNLTPAPGSARRRSRPEKRPAITQRVLQACDANDGLVDGQITQPARLPLQHRLDGPGAATARSPPHELAVAQGDVRRHAPNWTTGRRAALHRRASYGSEADWIPLFADNGGYGPFIGHYVYSLLTAAVRLAPRHQLRRRLRPREAGADAGHRRTEPRHHGASRAAAAS